MTLEALHSDDRGALYLGSWRELELGPWPHGRTHVITDPPFDERTHRGAKTNKNGIGTIDPGIGLDALTEGDMRDVCGAFASACDGWFLAFCAFEQAHLWRASVEAAGGRWIRTHAWVKDAPMPQISGDRPAQWGECIATCAMRSGRLAWNGGGLPGVYHFSPREPGIDRVHPTQKPIGLMRRLVELFTSPGDRIIDPFSGSGTTLRAARDLGRYYVGSEINPKYAASAAARLGAPPCDTQSSQRSLF